MKLLKNFIYSSSYQILLIILPIITAPYISRVLGSEGVGLNSYTSNVVQYFVVFSILGTTTYGTREIAYFYNNKKKRSQTFWEINFLSFITSSIALIFYLVFVFFINKTNTNLYVWQGIAIITSMFDISWFFSGRENFKIIVTRNFIVKILTLVLIFIFVRKSDDLITYVALMSSSALIGSISLWPYLRKEIEAPYFGDLNIFHHLKPTVMFFLPTIAGTVYTMLDKLLIGNLDSITSLSYYTQSDTIIRMSISVMSAMMMVVIPRITNLFSKGNINEIRRLIMVLFDISSCLSFGICAGISSVALKFAPYFFGKDFYKVGILLIVESPFVIALAWASVLGGQYLLPLKRLKIFTGSTVVGAIGSVILNFIFIPIFGVIGGSTVVVISGFLQCLFMMWFIRKEFNLIIMIKNLWKYLISSIIMFIVVFFINNSFKMNFIQLILQIFIGILIYGGLNILLRTQMWLLIKEILLNKKLKT